MLWLRALLFVLLLPATVGGLLPWLIARRAAPAAGAWRGLALALLALGWSGLLWCVLDFARRGRGTLAPVDPPRHLVRSGLYRVTRNPMYVSVLLAILGQAAWWRSTGLLLYAAVFLAVVSAFVRVYEEPALARQFGDEYERYRAEVPRWLGVVRRTRDTRDR
ncbi:MAG TPA: isoprenylcysteine carboxylmethyltransferase family protein [Gemmatimonadaceae bacterium]|nr:isoprenylcysteine carboxylmethyltransferase family protein [Gemmatimonadaceae bacterium]